MLAIPTAIERATRENTGSPCPRGHRGLGSTTCSRRRISSDRSAPPERSKRVHQMVPPACRPVVHFPSCWVGRRSGLSSMRLLIISRCGQTSSGQREETAPRRARPANKRMEPTRPSSRAILAAQRAAQSSRWADLIDAA